MANAVIGIILQTAPDIELSDENTIDGASVSPVIIASVPALYEMAIANNTDPADLIVANTAAREAEKTLKDLYDEGVVEIEINYDITCTIMRAPLG